MKHYAVVGVVGIPAFAYDFLIGHAARLRRLHYRQFCCKKMRMQPALPPAGIPSSNPISPRAAPSSPLLRVQSHAPPGSLRSAARTPPVEATVGGCVRRSSLAASPVVGFELPERTYRRPIAAELRASWALMPRRFFAGFSPVFGQGRRFGGRAPRTGFRGLFAWAQAFFGGDPYGPPA